MSTRTQDLKKANFLLLEDDPVQSLIYKKKLSMWDLPLETTYCEYGFEALLEFTDNQFDILMADIVMEGMDGLEMVRSVRASPVFSQTRILVVSSLSMDSIKQRGGLPPGVDYLHKPVDYEAMHEYLRKCCDEAISRSPDHADQGVESSE